MNKRMMDWLACPMCKHHPLELRCFVEDGEEVMYGLLTCEGCGDWYPIGIHIGGVPELLPPELRKRDAEDVWRKSLEQRYGK